ncbi:MAG: 2-hydroxyacid dehydrogenase [Pseudomonadota bacterium]
MKPEIIMIGPMLKTAMDELEASYTVHRYWEAEDKPALLAATGPRIRAIATDGASGVPEAVMAACPKIELIASFGVGYDGIDIPAAQERGIRVTTTPDVLNDCMAEITLGLMIALAHRLPQADHWVRQGEWARHRKAFGLTHELTGKTVGILGLGRIGKEIATRCQAMKMRVVYHGRREQAHQPYRYYERLEDMAREVDWLVVIAPGSAETKGIVSRRVMEALGPDGFLVNVGRGTLIDEPAMVELLASGALGGAALDVFEDEPNVPNELFSLENVVLSPHQGSATHKTRFQMGDLLVANMAAHFAGAPLVTPLV